MIWAFRAFLLPTRVPLWGAVGGPPAAGQRGEAAAGWVARWEHGAQLAGHRVLGLLLGRPLRHDRGSPRMCLWEFMFTLVSVADLSFVVLVFGVTKTQKFSAPTQEIEFCQVLCKHLFLIFFVFPLRYPPWV